MIDRKRTAARVGIFAALIGVELLLARSMNKAPSIRGYIDTRAYGVSSSSKALVSKIDVSLGQQVSAGQVIAELEGGSIDAELSLAMAERKKLLAGPHDDDALLVIDRQLEQLADKREALRLRAPADGIVESIDAHPGDAIGPENPVATVVAVDTRRVIACVPESRMGEVQIGSSADVTAVAGSARAHGTVETMTPAVALLPPRCQPVVAKPAQMGRLAVIMLDKPAEMLPGQSELIAFGPQSPVVVPPDAAAEAQPVPITVPPEIVGVSRFEASGLTWVPSLDRYVVVSDETDDRHTPWLFTMSRRGVLDPEPMLIADVDAFDDIESIAAGDNASLWVLASQSMSEKGNRPHARTLLAHLVPDGSAYKADRKVFLLELLQASPKIAAALGAGDLASIDIEGLAYRQGALYLGIKTPVNAEGRAMIWRVASPDKLLAGDLEHAGLSVFTSFAIPVEVDGHPRAGGVADLAFVSDSLLIVAATASGIDAKHQSGAVYAVRVSPQGAVASKLQTFRELRPEGVAIAPEGNRITVVFDRGRDAPMWTQLDVPPGDL
ncbi:MAG TPA: HlyD family efflux transporter periplasmic adaptor subunit [Kofleriaceae bacterium]